jgi:hypothetical protein
LLIIVHLYTTAAAAALLVAALLSGAGPDAASPHCSSLKVLAGPGSGKTRVLVGRVTPLINHLGVPPSQILWRACSRYRETEGRRGWQRSSVQPGLQPDV